MINKEQNNTENFKSIWLFKNLSQQNGKELKDINWSRKNLKSFSSIHSISSYLAMFSPSLPKYFIEKYTNENDIVMDNFSGRGTTALVSREMNRNFIGSDLNPYALVLSRMKIDKIIKKNMIIRIQNLRIEYENIKNSIDINNYEEMKIYYSNLTLSQLIFIRNKLGISWETNNSTDNAILSYALGLMQGKQKKNGESNYFSISMPNTISMSPNYVKKYAIANNLTKPNIDIFDLLIKRINFKFDKLLEEKYDGKIYNFDSTKKNENIKNNSVSLIITSPPYLNLVNYKTSNWLRLWLLGYERKELNSKIKLSDNLKFNDYIIFIKKYLNSIHHKLKKNAKVCLVVGDVNDTSLIENVWKKIEKEIPFKFIEIYFDYKYNQKNKITNMLNSKKGEATKIEKVLVLEKI